MISRRPPPAVPGRCLVPGIAAVALAVLVSIEPESPRGDPPAERESPAAYEARLRRTCSGCHEFPPPEALPRAAWGEVIEKMYAFLDRDGRPLEGFTAREVVAWYEARAPEFWELHPPGRDGGPLAFVRRGFRPAGAPPTPAISSLELGPGDGPFASVGLACDMRHHLVFRVAFPPAAGGPDRAPGFLPIGEVPYPCRTEICDLDGDGTDEILVADLGSFLPGDHDRGTVSLLVDEGTLPMRRRILADGLGRVSDARPVDLDGDGDLDVLVGVFGWYRTGRVLWLQNRTPPGRAAGLAFEPYDLDLRRGVIQTPTADLDGDGRPEVFALFSQEREELVVFRRRGEDLVPRTIARAPHPAWGSNGLVVVDLDRDGDLDVVVSNGDSLDDMVYKDYHGIRWYENIGHDAWKERLLALVYGVHGVRVADLDCDGDLDVVASAFIPQFDPERDHPGYGFPSLMWFEQKEGGRFEPWVLERRHPYHAALDVGDVDGDGDLDIVTGCFWMEFSTSRPWEEGADWIEVWRNPLR